MKMKKKKGEKTMFVSAKNEPGKLCSIKSMTDNVVSPIINFIRFRGGARKVWVIFSTILDFAPLNWEIRL